MRKAVAEKKVIKEEERGCGRKKGRSRGRKAERYLLKTEKKTQRG